MPLGVKFVTRVARRTSAGVLGESGDGVSRLTCTATDFLPFSCFSSCFESILPSEAFIRHDPGCHGYSRHRTAHFNFLPGRNRAAWFDSIQRCLHPPLLLSMPPEPSKGKLKRKASRREVEEYRFDGGHAREIEQKRNNGQISCAECRRCDHRACYAHIPFPTL